MAKNLAIWQKGVELKWPDYEVKAINTARIAGKTDAEIKALVDRLHAKRVDALVAA